MRADVFRILPLKPYVFFVLRLYRFLLFFEIHRKFYTRSRSVGAIQRVRCPSIYIYGFTRRVSAA